jgi:repressor LexA
VLTRKQNQVLETARRLEHEQGYAPSVRELARALDLSPPTVQEHLVALERKGFLRRSGNAFGLELAEKTSGSMGADTVLVPLRGTIAAGQPIEAIERLEDAIPMPRHMVRGECYFLEVRGDSMKDDHILDGDLVLIRRQSTVDAGEIAVALLADGTATLKRVFPEKGRFRLQPANEQLQPIYVKALSVQGKVVSVLRRYA